MTLRSQLLLLEILASSLPFPKFKAILMLDCMRVIQLWIHSIWNLQLSLNQVQLWIDSI